MVKKEFRKRHYFQIFILLVLIYFILAYTIINRETIVEQIQIIKETGSFFAQTATYSVLKLNNTAGFDKETYEIELEVFKQINAIRQENKLSKLSWDPKLSEIGRKHAYDMAKNNYFNHTNLKNQTPKDRAEIAGIKTTIYEKGVYYTGIGENIGLMPKGIVKNVGVLITTEDIASAMVYEWMLSEPHKKNILTKDYQFTGIGVAYNGKDKYYLVQEFQ